MNFRFFMWWGKDLPNRRENKEVDEAFAAVLKYIYKEYSESMLEWAIEKKLKDFNNHYFNFNDYCSWSWNRTIWSQFVIRYNLLCSDPYLYCIAFGTRVSEEKESTSKRGRRKIAVIFWPSILLSIACFAVISYIRVGYVSVPGIIGFSCFVTYGGFVLISILKGKNKM